MQNPTVLGVTGASATIGMIGAGRFGSYLATQLERAGYVVHTADVRAGAAYERDLARVCAAPTVIYAVPIRSLEHVLRETRHRLAPESVVLDVCSVKMIPCAILEAQLPGRAVAGTHPLFGPESAPDSCAGQRVALCLPNGLRDTSAGDVAVARAEQLFTALGVTIVRCSPEEHDAQIARSQFLTHFIARGTTRCGIGRVALSTKTHEDLMDIVDIACHDTDELFEDMAVFNPMSAPVRSEFLAALRAIDSQLDLKEQGAGVALARLVAPSRSGRESAEL
jgi:prephenate dehydrogenase